MNFIKILINFLFICVFILSCNNKKSTNKTTLKKIYFPDSIALYMPFDDYKMDTVQISNSKLKIFIPLNGSCSSCYDLVDLWDKNPPKINGLEIPVIFIINSKDNFELFKFLCENGTIPKFGYPFYLDSANYFESKNNIANLTLLVNDESEIIYTDVVRNTENIKNFQNKINKLLIK